MSSIQVTITTDQRFPTVRLVNRNLDLPNFPREFYTEASARKWCADAGFHVLELPPYPSKGDQIPAKV